MKGNSMILSTTPNIEGKKILAYKGIVVGEVISGVDFVKDFAVLDELDSLAAMLEQTERSIRDDHGLDPVVDGRRAAVILWTDDVAAGLTRLGELGGTIVTAPAPWLGRLLIAWAEDPDGHLVQVVQRMPAA